MYDEYFLEKYLKKMLQGVVKDTVQDTARLVSKSKKNVRLEKYHFCARVHGNMLPYLNEFTFTTS